MKKLLAVVVVLGLVAMSWGATVGITGANTQAEIQFKVVMAGLQLTFHSVGTTGLSQFMYGGATSVAWASAGQTLKRSYDHVMPCAVIHEVLWVENTGGLTADLRGYRAYYRSTVGAAADPNWVVAVPGASMTGCVGLASDHYKFNVSFRNTAAANITSAHAYPTASGQDMETFSLPTARYQFLDELVAEDPAHIGDGQWVSPQLDERTIDIAIVLPPGVGATDLAPDLHAIRLIMGANVD